jgi:hypothetical protein
MKAIQELQRLQNEINEEIEKFDLLLFELKETMIVIMAKLDELSSKK